MKKLKTKNQNIRDDFMIIAPSILSADFGDLKNSIKRVEDTKWLHVDVMDGHFVPNISIGPVVVKGLRPYTNQVLDTHLMIKDPLMYAKEFVKAGSDRITFHYETVDNVVHTIKELKSLNVPVGISIKPNTSVSEFMESALEKIRELKSLKSELNHEFLIVVDGGINEATGALCKEAGVDVLVAGSYIFGAEDAQQRIDSLR
jgi:ribulose-phosphate 3-epimerase